MKSYRVLYYTWNECTFKDCVDTMLHLGYAVDVVSGQMQNYNIDEVFMSQLKQYCTNHSYDCIFSFNYFPVISRVADECQIRYISWVYDSPHLTLDSVTLSNSCNRVFLFDRSLCQKYLAKGINTVHYMPLAYNHFRLEHTIQQIRPHYEHDITFLGTLYDDEYDFLSQVNYLPPKLEGYIEALTDAQLLVYGLDFCDLLFDSEKCIEMAQYVHLDMGADYVDYRDEMFRNMIRKKVTVKERRDYLATLSQEYHVDLYAPKKPENLQVHYKGYADYRNQMPEIFYTSKINLNITLRSILSGIPLRVIDILGAHGFLLTNYQPEFSDYFVNGEDLVWYECREDLLEKVNFYLTHDSERERIAHNGSQKIQKYFTYSDILPQIFAISLEDS